MKKVFVCLLAILLLCSCSQNVKESSKQNYNGVWISYYELNAMLENKQQFENEFSKVIKNCQSLNIKNLYIHTCAFGETLYNSDYFPTVTKTQNYDYDVFGFMVDECHKAGLLVHAWINPYRISSNTDVESLDTKSPAYKWLKDDKPENDSNVGFANGIYFNPASIQVRALMLDGIRELVAKYNVDGIHFDDYFYPTQSKDFDSISYNEYKSSTESPLSLDNWRRENVNLLISSVYSTVKYINRDIIFSISPAASLEHNFNDLYADVSLWIKQGYVDVIIPQVYFGFLYPDKSFCFENIINEWKKLSSKNPKVKLIVGLGVYKAVPTLEADKKEWTENTDIIARQVKFCDNDDDISGYVYFSYSSLFGEKAAYTKQRENVLEYLKTGDKDE